MSNHGATPPPLSPHSPVPARGMPETGHGGAAPLPPPRQGRSPLYPRKGRGARRGTLLSPHATRPQAPTRLLTRGPRQASKPTPAHKGATRTTPGVNR